MRRLLYIPVLHDERDLGSLGPALTRQSILLWGEERWAEYRAVVQQFWQRVGEYLLSLDPATLRLYQDGLAADGEVGRGVVEEAARRGSPNHCLLLELLGRGAVLRKTEDPSLLWAERENLLGAVGVGEKGREGEGSGWEGYYRRRERLMEARDRSIAGAINETLQGGEKGVLFLGAFHDVRPYLEPDIRVREVKALDKVRAYFQGLLSGRSDPEWRSLAGYISSPVLGG